MTKITTLFLCGTTAVLLAACSTPIPECHDQDLDKCGFGTVYSDERTALGTQKPAPAPAPIVAAPQPAPVAEPAPAPEPVAEPEPEPAPAPADTTIMRQADEPDFRK